MRKTDKEIQVDVIDELRWNPTTSGLEIGVAAKDGVVTLSGTVGTFVQKYAAERAAWSAPGVEKVDDELLISI
jgi:osmotically-inducible protein OsmY